MTVLKPCPFCGSQAERKTNKRYRKGWLATVGCKSLCPAKVSQATLRGDVEDAYIHAENMWNKRADKRMEWKCNPRELPNRAGNYICAVKWEDGSVGVCQVWFHNGIRTDILWEMDGMEAPVTHWMEFPQSPKEDTP